MIAIIDYKAGNLTSVSNALSSMGILNTITNDPQVIGQADRVIFPGVGAAKSAMETLRNSGLDRVIHEQVQSGKPFLGICLGTQIILEHSQENGGVNTLGVLPGNVVMFQKEADIKIPHMGWNQVEQLVAHPVFAHIPNLYNFYFVHSYYPVPSNPQISIAKCTYGTQTFTCVMAQKNVISMQFHPEKSGDAGLQLLRNFAQWNGEF